MQAFDAIFQINNKKTFEKMAMKVFRYQYEANKVYHQYCNLIKRTPENVKNTAQIPFLPISFFKTHKVVCSPNEKYDMVFTSSGTTGSQTSSHFVTDINWYEQSFRQAFSQFYGSVENYVVLALLPSYLERSGSSLVYMADALIKESKQPESGFYLHDYEGLCKTIKEVEASGKSCILIGVSYALLHLAEQFSLSLQNTIVMETGGMKGMRKELIREELHTELKNGLGVTQIHSEYGMTELLSQAYAMSNGVFECPNWMEIQIRSTDDPFENIGFGKTGGINVIDLANYHSCSFIATQDLGKKYTDGTFEVLGRFDHADIRGCNLLSIS